MSLSKEEVGVATPQNIATYGKSVPEKGWDISKLQIVFTLLEKKIFTFVKEELKSYQRKLIIITDDPQKLEAKRKNEPEVYVDDEGQRSKEDFLKIAQRFLRSMDEEDVAVSLQKKFTICQHQLKTNLRKKFVCWKGTAKDRKPTRLHEIYTELYVTKQDSGIVNSEHEVRQIETEEEVVRCDDIFRPVPGECQHHRTVMTCGVSGIGKTVSTHKFILDWAEEQVNQDIDFIFPFTFHDLNLLKGKKYSMITLLHHFFRETEEAGIYRFDHFQVLFILDGLDECRLQLDFLQNEIVTDLKECATVDVLLTNLIRGTLLPSARIWITTRPAAANTIPPSHVDLVTEIRGFTDPQKEEYFRRRFRDEELANRIICHIKTSRTLHIMCHLPVFCDVIGTVLETILTSNESRELPKTLTELYIHFLQGQFKLISLKYEMQGEKPTIWNTTAETMILDLGKLAFEQLEKGNLIFYEADLKMSGIDITAASVYSGVFTELHREERGLYEDRVFCFVHLSIQEFLAALYVFLMFNNGNVNLLSDTETASWWPRPRKLFRTKDLYQSAVDKALQSPNGHLDLFLRFLLGLSVETNQNLLQGLLHQKGSRPETNTEKTVRYIKKKIVENPTPERSINLFHCLNEMGDHSLIKEIQQSLGSGMLHTDQLSPAQWSALVFVILTSEEELDVFDLKMYSASEEGLLRLLPVVRASRKALLNGCKLTEKSCEALASALSSPHCNLKELDLSNNNLGDSGVEMIAHGLQSPHCRLETLRLLGCQVTEEGCSALVSALGSNPSYLRLLDLRKNPLGTSVAVLLAGLKDPHWKLDTLRVDQSWDRKKFGQEDLAAPSGDLNREPSCSAVASNDWTECNPVVNTVDEVQTYSFQSDAGCFQCSLSSLRWVCQEKVSFQYQFCSWDEHKRKPLCAEFMAAGPLLDITVTAGKLEEVQLPHWIDYNPNMSDMFVVLHVESCGDVVEKVSEVTSSHVKLLQPTFSPIGVMIRKKLGFPVKVFYDVLMYKLMLKTALKLYVYLVPPDPALRKKVEKEQKEDNCGSVKMIKPRPNKSMRLGDNFSLKTDKTGAEIQPTTQELRYDSSNFFEVFIRNPDGDFTLQLESEQSTFWTCCIHEEEYKTQSTDHKPGQHFVDQHRKVLVEKVTEIPAILDELRDRDLISRETDKFVRTLATTQDQMRKIFDVLTTTKAKDSLYEILKGMAGTKYVIRELEASG